jgi:hypothetical protein
MPDQIDQAYGVSFQRKKKSEGVENEANRIGEIKAKTSIRCQRFQIMVGH